MLYTSFNMCLKVPVLSKTNINTSNKSVVELNVLNQFQSMSGVGSSFLLRKVPI